MHTECVARFFLARRCACENCAIESEITLQSALNEEDVHIKYGAHTHLHIDSVSCVLFDDVCCWFCQLEPDEHTARELCNKKKI